MTTQERMADLHQRALVLASRIGVRQTVHVLDIEIALVAACADGRADVLKSFDDDVAKKEAAKP